MFDELSEHLNPSKYTPLNAPTRVRRMWAHRAQASHRKNVSRNLKACQGMLQDLVDSSAISGARLKSLNPIHDPSIRVEEEFLPDGEFIRRIYKHGKLVVERRSDDQSDQQRLDAAHRARQLRRKKDALLFDSEGRNPPGARERNPDVLALDARSGKGKKHLGFEHYLQLSSPLHSGMDIEYHDKKGKRHRASVYGLRAFDGIGEPPWTRNPPGKKSSGFSYTLKKVDGEYIVRFYKDGKWLGEGPTYYTDDKKDALGTAEHVVKRYEEMGALDNISQRLSARNPELLVWRNPGRRSSGLGASGLLVKRRKSKMRKRRKSRRSRRRSRNGKMYIKVGGKKLTWRGVVRKYGIKKGARRWKKSSKFHGGKRVTRSCRRRK